MAEESPLTVKAHDAIRSRRLPAQAPNRTFGGHGSDVTCAICGELVTRTQMEIEIEFNRHGTTPGLDRYHLHTKCFSAWESERKKVDGAAD
jgi:hypothetical protein